MSLAVYVAVFTLLALAADVLVCRRLVCSRNAAGEGRCTELLAPYDKVQWSVDTAVLDRPQIVQVHPPSLGWMVYIDTRQQSVDPRGRVEPSPYYISGFPTRHEADQAARQLRDFLDHDGPSQIAIDPPGTRHPLRRPVLALLCIGGFAYPLSMLARRRMRSNERAADQLVE